MANASSKRIATANETALRNLQLGLLIVNLLAPTIRFLLSLITSRRFFPRTLPLLLYIIFTAGSIFTWRWFVTIGSPKRGANGAQVRVGEDLGGKGVVELGWDLIYMTWICTLGSAILGDWVWWFSLLVPAFGAYKLFSTIRPILGMFLPGIFGPKAPKDDTPQGQNVAAGAAEEKGESRKQAKLRARMEKGDKRIQQVQRR
ncbi:hypothetical protein CI109_100622 [Kwoniella shandongensis]|uniref:Uncharacterized protein n=1 Tax=Kwoniella shandongensis TaxID=1734106 RepID=A0A5M6BZ63_9TREE|nr:uncharacterized protein CI109_003456 [Kwoniella shandongensis]KAA5528168.1 hypothetical protein CI109_003456 [Kwoniella shandongensis]